MTKETKSEVRARFRLEMTEMVADMHAVGVIDDATKEAMTSDLNSIEPVSPILPLNASTKAPV